jgi:hypothetical protein
MIHFNFIVEDVDAENLMWAIRNSALRNDEAIMKYMARQDMTEEQKEPYIQEFKNVKEYTLGLIEKMTNTRVEE